MFHQVYVAEPDREALRFLWCPGNDMTQPPVDYAMNVFLFGATCSPSCAAFALRKTAEDNLTGASNHAVQTVFKNFFVDDLLKSCSSVEEASSSVSELCPLLESGGFNLTKFLSNEPGVLSSVPEDDQASAMLDLNWMTSQQRRH